jgi:benzoate-CoA ligase
MAKGRHIDFSIPNQLNLANYVIEDRIKEGLGNKIAAYYKNETYTFSELRDLINKMGNVLREFDVSFEDRVLLILQDSPLWLAGWFATIKIGGVATHAYTYLKPADYEYFFNYVRPKVVIADETTIDRIRIGAKGLQHLKVILVAGKNLKKLKEREHKLQPMLEAADSRLEAAPTSKDDFALWNFSGGTTGKPKGVPHMHHDMLVGFESFKDSVKYREDDIVLRAPKLFFHYSRDLGMDYALRAGASVVLFPERSTAEIIFKMIDKYKPTVLLNVPTMMRAMLQVPKENRPDMSSLRLCLSSGEQMSAALYEEFTETFGVEVINTIGSAETYLGYFSDYPGEVVPGSAGRLSPLVEVKILGKDGKEVQDGETGVLWVRSDASGWCYHLAHEKTKATFMGNDWVNTNDLFSKDEKDYYWYKGRADDLIKVSGVYLAPMEIEKCLEKHEAIKECVVLGLKDKDNLVKSKAFIGLKTGFEGSKILKKEIQDFCRKEMASYKVPQHIEFFDELPKTGQGKIDKRQLRERGL